MVKIQTLCRSAIVIWIWNGFSALGTVYHSDGSAASVQGLHDQVLDGDTITLPSGTFSWTGKITITKAITIQGNSTTNVTAPSGTTPGSFTVIDNTIVRDSNSSGDPLIELRGNGGQRITGITFKTGVTNFRSNGMIRQEVGNTPTRIDHCHFDHVYWAPIVGVYCPNWGVIDHCVMEGFTNEGMLHFWPGEHDPNGNTGDRGDSLFEVPAGFGGPNFFFIETNWIQGGTDITSGGKICFRYNTEGHDNSLGAHGTGQTFPQARGGRAYEVYHNYFNWSNGYSSLDGGATSLYHDNAVAPRTLGVALQYYRELHNFGPAFFGADGQNAWDSNDPQLYDSGTLTSGTNESTLNDSTKHWTTNQWAGFNVRTTSNNACAIIVSNTATSLTIAQWIGQGWSSGQGYQIRKVLRIMDQPGLGAGDHINRASPTWPNQASEPCYSWNNVNADTGSQWGFIGGTASTTIQAGRDYINGTPMPGYTPYVYPHPLVSDEPTPSPTPSATVTPSPTPTATPTPSPTLPPSPTPTATPHPTVTPTPTPSQITLSARDYLVSGRRRADLSWSGATSNLVDLYRNGVLIATPTNDGFYTDRIGGRGPGNFTYQVCNRDTQTCSNQATVTF